MPLKQQGDKVGRAGLDCVFFLNTFRLSENEGVLFVPALVVTVFRSFFWLGGGRKECVF